MRKANKKLGTSRKTAQEILYQYGWDQLPILATLKRLVDELRVIEKEVDTYANKEETYKQFVKLYVGQSGQWLSYIRGTGSEAKTTSLDAIVKLKELSLIIWIKEPVTQKLYIVHTFDEGNRSSVDMLHTAGLTHFNLLKRKPA